MSAKVIMLEHYRSTVRGKNGVRFPQVYRGTGYHWDLNEDRGEINPSDRKAPPFYTLSDVEGAGYANVTWSALTRLEPPLDTDWLIIRHHMSNALVEGYLDGFMDLTYGHERNAARLVYETKEGLFTLLKRKPVEHAPDNLLIYVTKKHVASGPAAGLWVDIYHIVHPDGTISEDEELLFSPDEES